MIIVAYFEKCFKVTKMFVKIWTKRAICKIFLLVKKYKSDKIKLLVKYYNHGGFNNEISYTFRF